MDEVVELENQIMDALPAADRAAGMMDPDAAIHAIIRGAHDLLCNSWRGPGERLDALRMVAAALRKFNQ